MPRARNRSTRISSRASGASGTTWAPVACRNMASDCRRKRKSSRPRAHPSVQCLACGQHSKVMTASSSASTSRSTDRAGQQWSVTPVTWARCSVFGFNPLGPPHPLRGSFLWGVVVCGCGPLSLGENGNRLPAFRPRASCLPSRPADHRAVVELRSGGDHRTVCTSRQRSPAPWRSQSAMMAKGQKFAFTDRPTARCSFDGHGARAP